MKYLYPRSSASAARTPNRRSPATKASFDEIAIVGFKGVQAGVEQVALRNDDDVEPWRDLVATEDLSNESFRSISLDGAAELAGCRDAQPTDSAAVRQEKNCAEPAVNPGAPLVDLLEFRTAANALVWAEPQLLAADGQALTALGPPSLQHEAAVFSAHTHEKPMRLLAMTRVGLKSPDALSHEIPLM
jgi:hypothetical protein